MGSLEAEIDASFYNLVHQLSTVTDGPLADRRQSRRSRFVATHRIALQRAPGIPDEDEFIEVQCHDLNRKGFSFLLSGEPDFRFLVVAFGTSPNVIYLSARVTHAEPVLVYQSGLIERISEGDMPSDSSASPAQRMVLVGCMFMERLTASRQLSPVVE
jgi:hypothetical protein